MPRLFWKLFAAFWLTTVLILAISIYASFRLADRSTAVANMMDPREADAVLREILDNEGIAGLERWIADENSLPPGQTVYMIDEHGNDLLHREVPEFLKARARRMWGHVRGVREHRAQGGRRLRNHFLPLIEAADGRPLLAMPGPAPLSPFGVLSSAGLRWTVLAVAMFVSLASFWLLSRSLTRPALRISATAARLAAGDLAARVGGGYSNDEIGELARQFDRMAAQLQSQAELRRELFRNVSHELRAPLARLQIAAELAQRAPDKAEMHLARVRNEVAVMENLVSQVLALARAERVGASTAESARLDEVLADIAYDAAFEATAKGVELDWAGATPAAVQPDRAGTTASQSNLDSAATPSSHQKIYRADTVSGHQCSDRADTAYGHNNPDRVDTTASHREPDRVETPSRHPESDLDDTKTGNADDTPNIAGVAAGFPALRIATSAPMLRSAIENVVRNAIQMTPPGGRVRVDTEWSARECVVRITDAGPGVPGDELERIFQPFYRLDTNRGGSGIGLAITARVVQQTGGSVSARNAADGGLVVTLILPGVTH